jgi:cobalt-zinc-cadmium resistance protein CzcA
MIEKIIRLSVHNKLVVGLLVLLLIAGGVYNLRNLPIDAVPDITNNQVQVVTVSQSLAPQEVEQFITYPVEAAMANIPDVIEIRSISRFGLSVVTIVFKDHVPILHARQYVKEQISAAEANIDASLGIPELMPITTGLGEIYQYVLEVQPAFEDQYDATYLRTVQDWIVKRQLTGTPGIIDISSFGGYLKQYEVALDPHLLRSHNVSITEVFEALEKNNQNSGGSYIEKSSMAYYIRTEGLVQSLEDVGSIVIKNSNGIPVYIKNVGKVQFGSAKRFGAMTMDGKGEVVGGITLMLKGGNSSEAINNVHERIEQVRKSLPPGIEIYPYLDRSVLVEKTISTVWNNLLEGGLIVILILILLLGDIRAGLIVASVIPLAMLFAIILMNRFNVSANLMSLGAIDFGIVVDGAVIVVEGLVHSLFAFHIGKHLSQKEMDNIIIQSSSKLFRSAVFGVFIILVVFIPIMTLTGIEGKMFRPMAMTFSFAVLGAMILSLTYVPVISSLFISKNIRKKKSLANTIINFIKYLYKPILDLALRMPALVIGSTTVVLIASFLLFRSLGAEFIPTLEEGDLAMQMTIQPGSSLKESIRTSTKAERILLDNFPEIKHVVSKIGTAEVPTDPMAIEDGDIMIIMKDKEEWTSAKTREELIDLMKEKLSIVKGAAFEFTQPIQLRFNELMTGAKTDIAIKIFGDDPKQLHSLAEAGADHIRDLEGAGDVKVEQTEGLPQLKIIYNRQKIAQYGLNIEELNTIIRAGFAGEIAGVVYENERRFDLVVRLAGSFRENLNLEQLYVKSPSELTIPLSELCKVQYTEGPMQISREDARRLITIGVNVRNRDVSSLVRDIQKRLDERLHLPPGYSLKYGGEFENLQAASRRLSIAVPVALLLIFALLYFTFEKIKYALMIFTAVPLSAIGGIIALWIRGMPFSISAGVGFIALFGVAVLNGIVLISHFNRLRYEEQMENIRDVVIKGSLGRMRPVIMTATVAAFGFLPMALSTSNGAEVQKPLATVVIGGLITATLLTLILLPVLYYLVNKNIKVKINPTLIIILIVCVGAINLPAQNVMTFDQVWDMSKENHPLLKNMQLEIDKSELSKIADLQKNPLELEVSVGQLNAEDIDYSFQIAHKLNNKNLNKSISLLATNNTQMVKLKKQLLEKRLFIDFKRHWNSWIYERHKYTLFDLQFKNYQEQLQISQYKFDKGIIDKSELLFLENEIIQIQNILNAQEMEVAKVYSSIRRIAFIKKDFVVSEDILQPLSLDTTSDMSSMYSSLDSQLINIEYSKSQIIKNQVRPELTIGYINQSIQPDYSLQAISLGVALPLSIKHKTARIKRQSLNESIAINNYELNSHKLLSEFQEKKNYTIKLYKTVNTNGKLLLEKSKELVDICKSKLESGDIDAYKYILLTKSAIENELAYLQLVHKYNQAVLDLESLLLK